MSTTFVVQLSARCPYFNRLTEALAVDHPDRYLNIVSNIQRYHEGKQPLGATSILIAFNLMPFPQLQGGVNEMLRHLHSQQLLKTIRLTAMKVNLKEALDQRTFEKIEKDLVAYEKGEMSGERTACELASVLHGFPKAIEAVGASNVIF